jgi:hypothetical protein
MGISIKMNVAISFEISSEAKNAYSYNLPARDVGFGSVITQFKI